jgi:hypothetical protein
MLFTDGEGSKPEDAHFHVSVSTIEWPQLLFGMTAEVKKKLNDRQ